MAFEPNTYHVTSDDPADMWAREIEFLNRQDEIVAGEDYKGNAKLTKDANIIFELDAAGIKRLLTGRVHPAFEMGECARKKYELEFTYWFVKHNWTLPGKYKFVYNYFDRFINKPIPNTEFVYQGGSMINELCAIPDRYLCRIGNAPTYGFDQIKWLHDAIRRDGISRRHQMTTWIEAIDCFTTSPPCLQRIWTRVLVPKSEWAEYPGCIPVEAHIDYRSWDIPRAQPSNLYGLTRMLNRYVFGNLTEETEILRNPDGSPVLDANDEPTVCEPELEFKLTRLVGIGDSCHIYEDSYDTTKGVKRVPTWFNGVK